MFATSGVWPSEFPREPACAGVAVEIGNRRRHAVPKARRAGELAFPVERRSQCASTRPATLDRHHQLCLRESSLSFGTSLNTLGSSPRIRTHHCIQTNRRWKRHRQRCLPLRPHLLFLTIPKVVSRARSRMTRCRRFVSSRDCISSRHSPRRSVTRSARRRASQSTLTRSFSPRGTSGSKRSARSPRSSA